AKRLDGFAEQLDQLRRRLAASDTEGGYVSGEEQLRERYGNYYGEITGYDGKPTQTQFERHRQLQAELASSQVDAEKLLGEPLATLNGVLEAAGQEPLKPLNRSEWEAEQQTGSSGASPRAVQRSLWTWAFGLGRQH
ncbi:MAG: hypothetical protein KDI71_01575, partial [Xanthomonadales bacterium]|nr:hypothetical protein [Xanthomonadales bacterium]